MPSSKKSLFSKAGFEGKSTQKEIALRLGINQTSVSRALHKSPKVSKETIRKVYEEAEKLGYRPDPVLTRLTDYRSSKKRSENGSSIAWLTHYSPNLTIKSWGRHDRPLFAGSQMRANQLGYKLEIISITKDLSPKKIIKILSYRKVEGLIFPPQFRPHTHFNIAIDSFSCVAIGHTLHSPQLDQVSHSHFRSMVLAYRKLISRGYRRIGLIFNPESDGRSGGLWRGAYYLQQDQKGDVKIPVLEIPENDISSLQMWLKKWKPDSLIIHLGPSAEILRQLKKLGISAPKDLGIALLSLLEGYNSFAGIDERPADLGAFAVDILTSKIRNSEQGIPKLRALHLLDGVWLDGPTLVQHAAT